MNQFTALRARLFAPVDIASLALFRIAFGGVMLWQVFQYFEDDLIRAYWVEPAFHFSYPGFHWVKPWPGMGMLLHMGLLGVLSAMIAAGAFYRVSMALFCLGFAYTFLLEQSLYLNHYYFICLVSFLMIFAPAHRACSVDAWRRPEIRSSTVPSWSLWLLRGQLAIVYFYAGIAKLNWDWIDGNPARLWLEDKRFTPIVGQLFEQPETFYLISWCGLAFDLLVVPFLLWRRTRAIAFLACVCFHLLNAWFFNIGIFPWFSIAMTTLFFEPDWPRRFFKRWQRGTPSTSLSERFQPAEARRQRSVLAFIGIYAGLQILIPFRHWLYPGDVAWTEEGHQFSWRMKLRNKSGEIAFEVTNPATNETWSENPASYLTRWQVRALVRRPELIRQFAHHLASVVEKRIGSPVEVRAYSLLRLNEREERPIVDPTVDLAREPYRIGPADWIMPEPPPPKRLKSIVTGFALHAERSDP